MSDLKLAPGVLASRRFRCSHARSGRSRLFVVTSGLAAAVALALVAGASREFGAGSIRKSVDQSVLEQAPCCQGMGGVGVDPIASALPGTRFLESEGWRISNTDADPLVINTVTINGERAAPIGCGACGHVRRAAGRGYPVTVEAGESVRIFGYAFGDAASYKKPVKFLLIDTNRGKFRYSPVAGVEAE